MLLRRAAPIGDNELEQENPNSGNPDNKKSNFPLLFNRGQDPKKG